MAVISLCFSVVWCRTWCNSFWQCWLVILSSLLLLGRIAAMSRRSLLLQHGLCVLVAFVSPAKTVVLIEIPFGLLTRVKPRNHVVDGFQILQGEGAICWCCLAYRKAFGVTATVHAAIINNGISTTAAADCIPPDGRCHINFLWWKIPPLQYGLSSKYFDHQLLLLQYTNRVGNSEEVNSDSFSVIRMH